MRDWTKCTACQATLTTASGTEPHHALIREVTKGHLLYPSAQLFGLLSACERAVLKTIGHNEINAYTFIRIADNMLAESPPFVGCEEHEGELTKRVINYYLVTKPRILVKRFDQVCEGRRIEEQKRRKLAKLVD